MVTEKQENADLWQAYSDNWVRHLCVVAEETEQQVKLAMEGWGYQNLSTSLIYPLSIVSLGPIRPGQLADKMGISQQLCTKVQRQLNNSGYVQTSPDPKDGRARQLTLSDKGQQLIDQALSELEFQSDQYAKILKRKGATQLNRKLHELGQILTTPDLKPALQIGAQSRLNAVAISGVSRVIQYRIARLNGQRGHNQLRAAHWRIIHEIGLNGATTSELAKKFQVTNQAITRIVSELVAMGYISRTTKIQDKRSKCLTYTAKGKSLLASTVDSIEALTRDIEQHYASDFQSLKSLLSSLHSGYLCLKPSWAPDSERTRTDVAVENRELFNLKIAMLHHVAKHLGLRDPQDLNISAQEEKKLQTILGVKNNPGQIRRLNRVLDDILTTV